jgi:murein DD-endopeptidase MepM/ murein hydrolase activator NlpD
MKQFIFIFIVVTCLSRLYSEEAITVENQTKLETINLQIKENINKIQPKKKAKISAEKSLGKLSKQLKITELKLKKTKNNLSLTTKKKKKTTKKISELKKEFKVKKESFSKRLLSIYKVPELGIIEFLFSSEDLIMATEAHYYFDLLLQQDLELLETLKRQQKELKKEKVRLEKQENKISRLKKDIHVKESSLAKKKKSEKKIIAGLQSEINKLEQKNKELMKSSEAVANLIRHETFGKEGYYGTGTFIKPVDGWISSKYGYRNHPIFKRKIKHNGIDIAANTGYRIHATDSGFVLFSGQAARYKGYGKITIISHGKRDSDKKELSSFYAHQSKILVKKGDFVKQGDEIGWVGSTGYATGPHLHFEIRLNGRPVDPMTFLKL